MANEYVFNNPALTGRTLYVIVWEWDDVERQDTGQAWDTANQVFETPGATVGDYDVSCAENANALGLFTASQPTGLALNIPVLVRFYLQAGGSPAWGDHCVGAWVIGERTGARAAIFDKVIQTAAKASAAADVDFEHLCRLLLAGSPFGVTSDDGTTVAHKTGAGGDTLGTVTVVGQDRTAVTIAADPGA